MVRVLLALAVSAVAAAVPAATHSGRRGHHNHSGHALPKHTCVHDRLLSTYPGMRNVVHGPPAGSDGGGSGGRGLSTGTGLANVRIGVQYVQFTADPNMDATLLSFLQNTVIPTAVGRLQQFLRFTPLTGPLYGHRECDSNSWDTSPTPATCTSFTAVTGCANDPSSDDVTINFSDAQLGSDTYYTWNAGTGAYSTANVIPAGTGFPGSDFVLFATAKQTSYCGTPAAGGAIAYAMSCQRDGATDRPTFGRANFCPLMLKEYYSDPDSAIQVVMHEMLHALGFTSDSWPLFRFAGGTPRTPRNPSFPFVPGDDYYTEYACGGYTYSAYVPAGNTVSYFTERGMTRCDIPNGLYPPENCVARFTTPTAAAAAQAFFNCSSLAGPELENQLTTACQLQGSHWEFRVLASEMLNSFDTGMRQGFSTLTVSVLEDAGWGYVGNYSAVDTFMHDVDWGYKQGCEFASGKCLSTPPATGTLTGLGTPPHFMPAVVTGEAICRIDRMVRGRRRVEGYTSSHIARLHPVSRPFLALRFFVGLRRGGHQYLLLHRPAVPVLSFAHPWRDGLLWHRRQ